MLRSEAVEIAGFGVRQQYPARRKLTKISNSLWTDAMLRESLVSRLDALNRTSNQSTEGLRLSNLRMIP
jgi:hypothetical protein